MLFDLLCDSLRACFDTVVCVVAAVALGYKDVEFIFGEPFAQCRRYVR